MTDDPTCRPAANWRAALANLARSVADGTVALDPATLAERFCDAGPRIGDLPSDPRRPRGEIMATVRLGTQPTPAELAEDSRERAARKRLDATFARLREAYGLDDWGQVA